MEHRKSWEITTRTGLAGAFLLAGYEFVRSTANTLFKGNYGKEALPLAMTLIPIGIVAGLYIYGKLLTDFGPRKTLRYTSVFSALSFFVGYFLYNAGFSQIVWFLFVLKEVYVVLIIEQYWSFMVSVFTVNEAKIVNGPFCGIASIGSITGAFLMSWLTQPLGVSAMLLIGSVFILPAVLFMESAYSLTGEPQPKEKKQITDHIGIKVFFKNPSLFLLFLLISITQQVAAVLDLAFQSILHDTIPDMVQQNIFSGRFFGWLNLLAGICQFLLTPLFLNLLSINVIHYLIPLVHFALAKYMLFSPTLFSAGAAFMVFKILDYSIFRAAKEILYIPLSFDIRYRAKEIIDVMGYRLGKGGATLLITLLQSSGHNFTMTRLATWAIGGIVIWLAILGNILQMHDTEAQAEI